MWWSSLEIGVSFTFSFLLLVQHECIPQAILGMDVLCQAKSGMGKTAVFVLATLQQLEPVTGQVHLQSAAQASWPVVFRKGVASATGCFQSCEFLLLR